MLVDITKIEGDQLTVNREGKIKTFTMEEFVISHAKIGTADITFNDESKTISFIKMEITEAEDKAQSSSKKSGKWEDDMVTFEVLLTKAHSLKMPFSIKTEMLAIDLKEKYALFKARVIVTNGEIIDEERAFQIFEGHGDATDLNVKGEHIKPHFIRMAETRAIVRALRWYTNNGCAEEEKA